jgi:hypothetical protein
VKPYQPTIFIGSSSEGLEVARAIKQHFQDFEEVDIWTDNVFSINQAYLESLLRAANLYDFAILCLTADDVVESRGLTQKAPRDNLLFELGLFMGRMGASRAFIVCEDAVKLLSDFQGIKINSFQRPSGGDVASAVEGACHEIRKAMQVAMQKSEPGFLPSTALAIGYFENFVNKIYEALANHQECFIERASQTGIAVAERQPVDYEDFKITLLIPENLDDLEKNNLRWTVRGYDQVILQTGFRRFPFYVQKQETLTSPRTLDLFDIPTTLLASRQIVRMLVGSSALGEDVATSKLEQREIVNFTRTLLYQLKGYRNVEVISLSSASA